MSQPSASETSVRRDLPVGERAVGEVPERALPRDRLVDDLDAVDLAEERGVGGRHDPAVERPARPRAGSVGSRAAHGLPAPEAVGPHAQVAVGVDRAAAERAGRAGRRSSDLLGPLDEGAGAAGVDPDQEDLVGLGLLEVLVDLVGRRRTAASVNGNTSITTRSSSGSQDSVIVPARNSSSIGCSSGSVSSRSSGATAGIDGLGAASAGHHLVEQLVDPLGEGRHLLLLQRDADHAAAAARLQEERALPGLADRAGDEALGRVEAVDDGACRHPMTAGWASGPGAAADGGVAAAPCVARGAAWRPAAPARTGRPRGCSSPARTAGCAV